MKIRFLEIAQIELDEAISYYNRESPGVGSQFLSEVLNALDRIANFPEAWHPCSKRTRRCLVRRFPYGIVYRHVKDDVLVVAVAHLHREPTFWEDRLHK